MPTKSFSPSVTVSLEGSYSLEIELRIDVDIDSVETVIKINDPIEIMFHALQTDVQSLSPSISLRNVRDGKHNNITCILNSLSSYTQLESSAKRCGLVLQGIRVTNMVPCAALLKSIQDERDLEEKFKNEIEDQNQKTELKKKLIETEAELTKLDEELEEKMHDIKMESLKRAMAIKLEEIKMTNQISMMRNETFLSFLKELKSLDVDVTKYLSSKVSADSTSAGSTGACALTPPPVEYWQKLDLASIKTWDKNETD